MKRLVFTLLVTAAIAMPGTAARADNFFAHTNASAAADTSAAVDAKSLTSAQVTQIQQALVASGYHVDVDGRWRASTRNAVQAYQRSRGIRANGALTTDTLAGL